MQTTRSQWERVSRSEPCTICGKPDWCGFVGSAFNPAVARCMRVPGGKADALGGYLYFDDNQSLPRYVERKPEPVIDYAYWDQLQATCKTQRTITQVKALADSLGVSIGSLLQLGIGKYLRAGFPKWTFPMYDGQRRIIGMRTRDGRVKMCIQGTKVGLFLGPKLTHKRWLVVEGESDCAAAITLGIQGVVGVPGAGQAQSHLLDLARANRPSSVVFLADNDEVGREGMMRLKASLQSAMRLCGQRTKTELRTPIGAKDLREWVKHGACRQDIVG